MASMLMQDLDLAFETLFFWREKHKQSKEMLSKYTVLSELMVGIATKFEAE